MGSSLNELVEIYDNQIDIISTINKVIDLVEQIRIIQDSNILHSDIKCSNICYGYIFWENTSMIRKLYFIYFSNAMTFKENNKIVYESNNAKPLYAR
jgi:hypothetical protein